MAELEDDIRATVGAITDDSERLRRIEEEKAGLEASDPRMKELSAEAARLGDQVAAKTHAEEELVREASQDEKDAAEGG